MMQCLTDCVLITHLGKNILPYMPVRVEKFHITGSVLHREEMWKHMLLLK